MTPRVLGQATILVIDDSDAVLASTRAMLEAAGFRVITQTRAADAITVIRSEKPDLVLADLGGGAPGAELLGRLFGRDQASGETVLLLHSTLTQEAARARALAVGAHGHISKNEDSFEFLRQIDHWLKVGVRSSHSRLRAASRPGSPSTAVQAPSMAPARASGAMRLDLPSVLFIDDDMGALSGFRREVQSEPYSVEFALSGPRALERILSETPPDVVVSDLLMPEPAGPAIYRQAVAVDPSWETRFVLVTGAALMAELAGFLAEFRGVVLYKPVAGQDLREAIRRALGERALARAAGVVGGGSLG